MPLTEGQQKGAKAFSDFLYDPSKKEFAITGSPGSGKTYLTRHLVREAISEYKVISMLRGDKADLNVLTTATTNTAAGILAEEMQVPDTTTVHSTLGLRVYDNIKTGKTGLSLKRNAPAPLTQHDLLIVDEASMIDPYLKKLINKQAGDAKILYLLDKYQLPPVGSASMAVDTDVQDSFELTEIVRNSGHIRDMVLLAREAVKTNAMPSFEANDTDFMWVENPAVFREMLTASVVAQENYKVLFYDNASVLDANRFVRNCLGLPEGLQVGLTVKSNKPLVGQDSKIVAATDSVHKVTHVGEKEPSMEHGFSYQKVSLSALGTFPIIPSEEMRAYKRAVSVAYHSSVSSGNFSTYFMLKNLFGDLRDDFASTVHKAQGSSYDKVFVDLSSISRARDINLCFRLLYVAISRARKQVIMTGNFNPRE